MTAPPPPNPAPRILALDALRGLAVIGIAWINVLVFAMPQQAYLNPLAWGGETSLDRAVWLVSFVFVEDKFRTLFAMLFGAGCLILLDRGGEHPWRAHAARMIVLLAIGIGHSVLLASNDVLRAYALAGLAVPLLAPLSARALAAVAVGLVVVHVGLGLVALGGGAIDHYTGRLTSDATLFAERNFGRDPAALAAMLEQGREGLAERIVRRSTNIPGQLMTLIASLPINLAAIALGMALWKDRLLAGEWRLFRLQRLAAVSALAAIPALLGQAAWLAVERFPGALTGLTALVLSAPFDTLLGVTYAALAMAFLRDGGAIVRRLAAVGRLSLSNYLMTSVILAAIFAPWGLGLFGGVSRWQAFGLSFVPIAAMLAWSPVWVERIGQGPVERLWRAASKALS